MAFEPIAIVGQGCVLPGASTPEALWEAVREGRVAITSVPEDRWGIAKDRALASDAKHTADRAVCDRGGYVEGFDFDPSGLRLPVELASELDPLFQWVLHAARAALEDARFSGDRARVGAVVGNLGFPSEGLARYASRTWLGDAADRVLDRALPHERFMSGLPAHLLASALGLGGGAFAIDAACASSLYALKLGCDALHDRRVDLVLAGAVNRADPLFLHVGFTALSALSPTGRSLPFDARADGLLPAEGAAFVALKRLDDAVRDGDRIHGVIRGVGLSNDGRGRGMLAPSEHGQARAMRSALAVAGWDPGAIRYVECHATGTPVGDATELRSMREVYGDAPLPIGSLKANLGHLITAAGMAGLLKVLAAMRHRTLPPTPGVETLNPAFSDTSFRVPAKAEPWEGPLRAAISAFGFGGNNAHVLVEAFEPERAITSTHIRTPREIAIVGIGARVAGGASVRDLIDRLRAPVGAGASFSSSEVSLPVRELRSPPADLAQALGQQTLLLSATLEATQGLALPAERTGVLVGSQCDAEVARYGARWRMAEWGRALGMGDDIDRARDALTPVLRAAGVLGTMPNMPANRLNAQLDAGGPSFTISSEELSGVRALELACRALAEGELDIAIVGASDLSDEPVHTRALAELTGNGSRRAGDAAVVLVLERLEHAKRSGRPILAVIDEANAGSLFEVTENGSTLEARLGHAHAASGLVHVAAAALACGGLVPGEDRARVRVRALGGQESTVSLRREPGTTWAPPTEPNVPRITLPTRLPRVSLRLSREREQIAGDPVHGDAARAAAPSATNERVDASHLETRHSPGPEPMQRMDPAPWLPPVDGAVPPSFNDAPIAEPLAAMQHAPVRAVPATLASVVLDQQRRIAATHFALFNEHTALLSRFIHLRENALKALCNVAGAGFEMAAPATPMPVLPVVPVPVITPAPAQIEGPITPAQRAPLFDRRALEVHASGTISELFGPQFQAQDEYRVQVRMPEPPLLLADRVMEIHGEPGSMGKGSLVSETTIGWDSWYLHDGRMPAGILIESGQADLFLISYLGIDLLNRGERAYRLLGCELTYHGSLPVPGDTLRYTIHVDGHAKHGDVRLFFFHYDCESAGRPVLSVRQGQAGFFSEEELRDSAGILWNPEEQEIRSDARVDAPKVDCTHRSFTKDQVRSFSEGDTFGCFGPAFELARTHNRSPRIQSGDMLLSDRITDFDPEGGPWKRGYLRSVKAIAPNDWFFAGHFKNDPCMPGTLMFEGCLQMMAFYLAALGYTLERDGHRFEPVPEEAFKLLCRGQVLPSSRELVYEIFVEEVHDGPLPTLYADLLCTVDGLPAFHARRMALRLVPDWPLTSKPELLADHVEPKPVAVVDGFPLGYASLLACAWGRPSDAFGAMYRVFDGTRRVARLPGPPYHFMSRVTHVDGEIGQLEAGARVTIEYDVPNDAWYFAENGARTMPFAVLLEAALQPCGWLASFVGSALTTERDLSFRNLDGKGTVHVEVLPDAGTFRTEVTITRIDRTAGMIIQAFDVVCFIGDTKVYTLQTVFGFFPPEALANQVGLPTTDAHRALFAAESSFHVDLEQRPPRYCAGAPRLAAPMLLMLDRVTAYDPAGGRAGLGTLRAEKDVDPGEWFFKAHFFQDPVQPGSLGLEAILQLVQFYMIERDLGRSVPRARFEPILVGREHRWKYRGQVVPKNRTITTTLEIVEVGEDERGPFVMAEGSLWVDGKRIYEAGPIGMRIVPGDPHDDAPQEDVLDPAKDTWIGDHRPTFTVPALPMMSVVDRLARAAFAGSLPHAFELRDLRVDRWVVVSGPTRLRVEVERAGDEARARLLLHREARDARLSRFEPVAAGVFREGAAPVEPLPPLTNAVPMPDPYASGELFHGPAFQLLRSLSIGSEGASAVLDAGAGSVPFGVLHPALLDAATHAIPHDRLHLFSDRIGEDQVAYPHRLEHARFHGPPPTSGEVRCEVRFDGFDETRGADAVRFPCFRVQLLVSDRVWLDARLVEVLLPKGPLGAASPEKRRAFLAEKRFVPGLRLSRADGEATRLSADEVKASDWLPGTVQAIYATGDAESTREVAIKEHIAARSNVHPYLVDVEGSSAVARTQPLCAHHVDVSTEAGEVVVRDAGSRLELAPVERYWRELFALGPWPVEDLYFSLCARFIADVSVEDPDALDACAGRPVLFLANHQVGIESLLFSIVASALVRTPTLTLAKDEHRESWLGRLIAHCFAYPGARDPGVIAHFDRSDPESLPAIARRLGHDATGAAKSLMVHVEGTRALSCRQPIRTMSGVFVDLAVQFGLPIVPVRFAGGLPIEPLEARVELPVGMGRQRYFLGRPILASELASLPYRDRVAIVKDRIDTLGPGCAHDAPEPGDPALEARVREWHERTGASWEHATLLTVLADHPRPTELTARLVEGARSGRLVVGDSAEDRWLAELARRLYGPRGPAV